jgi:hypothetical protein
MVRVSENYCKNVAGCTAWRRYDHNVKHRIMTRLRNNDSIRLCQAVPCSTEYAVCRQGHVCTLIDRPPSTAAAKPSNRFTKLSYDGQAETSVQNDPAASGPYQDARRLSWHNLCPQVLHHLLVGGLRGVDLYRRDLEGENIKWRIMFLNIRFRAQHTVYLHLSLVHRIPSNSKSFI